MIDILIKNGKIIDGTGKDAYVGTFGIKDGKIVSVGSDEGVSPLPQLNVAGIEAETASLKAVQGKFSVPHACVCIQPSLWESPQVSCIFAGPICHGPNSHSGKSGASHPLEASLQLPQVR